MKVITLCSVLVLSTTSGIAQDQQKDTQKGTCDVWSVKGMSVGMTLAEFKKMNPKARLERSSYLQKHVKEGQWWFAKKKSDYRTYALPLEDDKEDSPLVCFLINFDIPAKDSGLTRYTPEVSPSSIVEELRKRWGEPVEWEKEVDVPPAIFIPVPKGGIKRFRSTWVNEACDTVAVAERSVMTYPLQTEMLTVWLRSKSRMIDPLQKAEEERAKKALEPSVETESKPPDSTLDEDPNEPPGPEPRRSDQDLNRMTGSSSTATADKGRNGDRREINETASWRVEHEK